MLMLPILEKNILSMTILTFSVHCILINWPPHSFPTGLWGYKQIKRWKCEPTAFLITEKVKGMQ